MSIEIRGNADRRERYVSPAHSSGPHQAEDVVAIRRNVGLSSVVGGAGLLFGSAYLIRSSGAIDVLVGLVLLGVAISQLPTLAASRTPVLVADERGVRFRVGAAWRGLPWSSVRQVVVEPASSPLREGRLVVVPRDPASLTHRSGAFGDLHLRWNTFWYGAGVSVPLGLSTIVDSEDLAADLAAMSQGRVEIVDLGGRPVDADVVQEPEFSVDGRPVPDEDGDVVVVGFLHDDAEQAPGEDEASEPAEEVSPVSEVVEPVSLPEPVLPLRDLHQPTRVDVRLEPESAPAAQEPQLEEVSHDEASQQPIEVVIDDLAADPVVVRSSVEPVIGTKITRARECLDMSIDELSQRTRIRPHVLEAIEQDDFVPCGGDFYARGHLTAISRALGLSLDPLLQTYDERYAQAPINARRVFEAELSSGLAGGPRATLGGPRWSLLIGCVLALTLVWGLARVFAGAPEQLTAAPGSSDVAGLTAHQTPITSPLMKTTAMSVRAAFATTHVVITDRTDKVLWSGKLLIGKTQKIVGVAPFKVKADNAGAVEVRVKGKPLGFVGTAGVPGTKSFG